VEAIGDALAALTSLKRLDVQSNRLVAVDGLGAAQATSLEELYLARNGITSLFVDQDTHADPSAPFASAALPGASPKLLSRRVPSLGQLQALHTVDLSSNRLASLAGLGACQGLSEVWASGNAVNDLELGFVVAADTEASHEANAAGEGSASGSPSGGKSEVGAAGGFWRDGGLGDLETLPKLTCVYLEHNPAALALGNSAQYRAALKAKLPRLTQIDATTV
jgi:hypothetical protein